MSPSQNISEQLAKRMEETISEHHLIEKGSACLLMISGGSDSTALAYLMARLRDSGVIPAIAILHVDHKLRGRDSTDDALFVRGLAEKLDIPFYLCEIDIKAEASRTNENIEAVARRERYIAASEALESLCTHTGSECSEARILTAHTLDDRMENFYMRSIVGTGPGGFRSMLYRNGPVVRPLLDCTRDELREYIVYREDSGMSVEQDSHGDLWREDATNAHTDRFRSYVRHEMVPVAKDWMAQAPSNLRRSMNLIGDEDDMLDSIVESAMKIFVAPLDGSKSDDHSNGFLLIPDFGNLYVPIQRRIVHSLLKRILGQDERIDVSSVEAILSAFGEADDRAKDKVNLSGESDTSRSEGSFGLLMDKDSCSKPKSGYVTNIQGDLAVSANKHGVRVEHMQDYRKRRKRDR